MRQTATRAEIDAFERRIRALITEGYAVQFAVRQAYKEYPVMRVLFGELIDQIRAEAERGYGEVLPQKLTDRLFTQSWTPDNLTLSERTTRGGILVRELVARTISEQIKRSATYRQASLAIFDGYQEAGIIPTQNLPKFLQDLTQVAHRAGVSRGEILAALKPIRRQIAKGTTAGMRAAYSQLVNALEDQNEKALDKAIYAATQERTRYFADRIARTEMARAYQDGFLLKWDNNDDCVAYQWKLSGRHPRYDICDLYAKANLYGMGPGIFPKDKVPRLPAHPHCMCFLKPVIHGMLDNETPIDHIEEGGREYLDSVSLHHRQMLLGVHGVKDVMGGKVSWTQKARGYGGKKIDSRLSPNESQSDILKKKTFEELQAYIGKLDNKTVREWYIYQSDWIHAQISTELPIEERARQAFELRNQYRRQARDLMADQELRRKLDREDPVWTWEALIAHKMQKRPGISREDAVRSIYESAVRSRRSVNEKFGLG
ncbi:hypothetical protein [Selenomonas noxia]|uniref:hypothetical protein n=1 Tax=Selenomonas noxia TaxID=135083 RepID=UPI002880533B|nr:hypothetical protein [Selenomonas noxia]